MGYEAALVCEHGQYNTTHLTMIRRVTPLVVVATLNRLEQLGLWSYGV